MNNEVKNSNQAELKQRLLNFINEKGTKFCYVAAQIDVPHSVLSHFRYGRRNLWDTTAEKLDLFLKSENY